ncbi:MAG: hypothetical protein DIZ80_00735 [endosymbiont of Galathealinum brachiosum]|uniref:Phosphate ABC transporter substrate-binding protein n=1 Tax=endosymbiont of Galathealinum brachiosum TaxID=2200906 RepID=A0A370DM97_9GAMM|nr:MAG: hypothetical protein DIZ80_00735 [endosymbiont of Galathealinum brachiosum]
MKRRSFIKLSSCILAGGLLPLTTTSQASVSKQRPLIMGIFPRRNIKLTYQIFTPMARYLSNELGREVKLITAKNFKQFWLGVKEQRYDLVHYNQYHYIISHLLYDYQVILKNQEFGQSTVAGSIVVRKDSGIDKVSDLENKTILFGGGKMAMQSYIAAKWLLKQGGLNSKDYQEKFSINPPNAIMSTFRKQADAAGSGDVVIRLDVVKSSIDVSQMKYLARTRQLTHLPWAVKHDMEYDLKLKIQLALSSLNTEPAGQKILDQAKLSSLIPATDSEYNGHREIIQEVYGKDYGIEKFK